MENEMMGYSQNGENDTNVAAYENIYVKLWNPKWFTALGVLFSFLPAAILCALNYGRLGDTGKKNNYLIISGIGFVAMILLAFIVQQDLMKYVFYALNIGIASYMSKNQTDIFKNHINSGGQKASYIVPVVVCILVTVVIVVSMIYTMNIPEQKMIFGDSELYYTENVQKSEVEKLGAYLVEQGFLGEGQESSVKIDKLMHIYVFSFIPAKESLKEYLNDPEWEQAFKEMSNDLSRDVFDDSVVAIVLCDNTFKPLKTIYGQDSFE